jgi:hypothetical protein
MLRRIHGQTFRIIKRKGSHGMPGGWELSAWDLEPDVGWSFLSLWKTKREATEAAECFV